jgi:magnesium transporter
VSVALTAASAFACLIALGLPWVLYRFGRDPAFGTGPVATIVEDLFSISLFFGISILLVR